MAQIANSYMLSRTVTPLQTDVRGVGHLLTLLCCRVYSLLPTLGVCIGMRGGTTAVDVLVTVV